MEKAPPRAVYRINEHGNKFVKMYPHISAVEVALESLGEITVTVTPWYVNEWRGWPGIEKEDFDGLYTLALNAIAAAEKEAEHTAAIERLKTALQQIKREIKQNG